MSQSITPSKNRTESNPVSATREGKLLKQGEDAFSEGIAAAKRARSEIVTSKATPEATGKLLASDVPVSGKEQASVTKDDKPKIERSPIFRTVFKDDPNKPRSWQDWPFGEMPFPADRRRQKTTSMREAILRSAARAFSHKGYHGTSMDDIAKELMMTKGALYYYFRDKEDILYACHDYSLSLVLENLATVEASDAGPEEKLRALIKAHVGVMLDALQGSAMALDFNALAPNLFQIIVEKRDRFERGMRKMIADGMVNGSFRKGDEKLAAFMILGAINWITKWYREGGTYNGDIISDTYAETFIHGLKGGEFRIAGTSKSAASAAATVGSSAPKPLVRAKTLAKAVAVAAPVVEKPIAKQSTKAKKAAAKAKPVVKSKAKGKSKKG